MVKAAGAHHGIYMISAITAKGALRFAGFEGNLNVAVFIEFLQRLLYGTAAKGAGPVYLVVDGHPAHRASVTKEFVASTGGRLRLVFLPGYSPVLNPDEWVWKNGKHDQIARTGVTSAEHLKSMAIVAPHRLQKLPQVPA